MTRLVAGHGQPKVLELLLLKECGKAHIQPHGPFFQLHNCGQDLRQGETVVFLIMHCSSPQEADLTGVGPIVAGTVHEVVADIGADEDPLSQFDIKATSNAVGKLDIPLPSR